MRQSRPPSDAPLEEYDTSALVASREIIAVVIELNCVRQITRVDKPRTRRDDIGLTKVSESASERTSVISSFDSVLSPKHCANRHPDVSGSTCVVIVCASPRAAVARCIAVSGDEERQQERERRIVYRIDLSCC